MASRSSHARTSSTAAWCAARICSATSTGAIAHSVETLLTGVKVRSNPATARGGRPGVPGDERGQLTRVLRRAAVLGGEHVPPDVGADPGPLRGGQRPVPRHPQRRVDLRAAAGHLDPEPRRGVHHRERLPEPDRRLHVLDPAGPAGAAVHHRPGDRVRVRVLALGEQGRHLLGGHLLPGLQVDVGQGGAEPHPGGLATLGVVVGQAGVPAVGRIQHGDLPGQVGIPVPGGQLVDRHHTPVSTTPPSGWTPSQRPFPRSNIGSTPSAEGVTRR